MKPRAVQVGAAPELIAHGLLFLRGLGRSRAAGHRRPVRGTDLPLSVFLDEDLSDSGEVIAHGPGTLGFDHSFRVKMRHGGLALDEGNHLDVLGGEVDGVECVRPTAG